MTSYKENEHKKPIFLEVKDHSVSNEVFKLIYNEELDLLETSPQPQGEKLFKYYKSEDYISHTDSKRNWFEKLYHLIKSIALKRKVRLLNSFNLDSKNLLDVGCGTGDFLDAAEKSGWSISGIEPNEDARSIAKNKIGQSVFDIEHLNNFKDESFDVITLWHVLEHLPELDNHIKVFRRLLKPNGRLVIAVPNYKSFDADYYKEYWAAYDVPRHLWHFSRKSISKLFKKRNLYLERTLPMIFDAYYVALLSEKYKSGFMNPFKAFWIGLRSNLKARRSKEYSSLIYILKREE